MFGNNRRKSQHRKDDLSGYIHEGSEIDGTYAFTGTVMLNDKFKGETQSSDTFIIGEKGVVKRTSTSAPCWSAVR
jgi:cytoskeletal protein CcmA (bactofilin family)